jgi:hypothetical protein
MTKFKFIISFVVIYGAIYGMLRYTNVVLHQRNVIYAGLIGHSSIVQAKSKVVNIVFFPLRYIEMCYHNKKFIPIL